MVNNVLQDYLVAGWLRN